jgi:hypothetical protein
MTTGCILLRAASHSSTGGQQKQIACRQAAFEAAAQVSSIQNTNVKCAHEH